MTQQTEGGVAARESASLSQKTKPKGPGKVRRVFNMFLAFVIGAAIAAGATFIYMRLEAQKIHNGFEDERVAFEKQIEDEKVAHQATKNQTKNMRAVLALHLTATQMKEAENELSAMNFGSAKDKLVHVAEVLKSNELYKENLQLRNLVARLPTERIVVAEDIGPQKTNIAKLRDELTGIIAASQKTLVAPK